MFHRSSMVDLGLNLLNRPENDRTMSLEAMLTKSPSNQQEVTDQLGYQVRRAGKMLEQALDRIDRDRNRQLLKNVSAPNLNQHALRVMIRRTCPPTPAGPVSLTAGAL